MKAASKTPNQKVAGFSMIEAIIAMGLLAAGCLFIMTLTSSATRQGTQTNVSVSLTVARGWIMSYLVRDDAFANTALIAANGFPACSHATGCSGAIRVIKDSNNGTVFDSTVNPGFGYDGTPCPATATFPSVQCPIGVTMNWKEGQYGCTSCTPSLAQVDVKFSVIDLTTNPPGVKTAPPKYNLFILKTF